MKPIIYSSKTYEKDLIQAIAQTINFEKIFNKTIMITGASGLIGSYLVDVLLCANRISSAGLVIIAVGRNLHRLQERFSSVKTNALIYLEQDVNETIQADFEIDYIIHAAGNAFPAAFNADPVGTMLSNIIGTINLLDYGKSHNAERLLYVSSGEVYGKMDINNVRFNEADSGYVDPVQVRSCYPSSKRAAENLCVSYTKQYNLDTVIVRPCHTYGPSATKYDNRANVQFVNNALNNHNIILNSAGTQMRSYCYVSDMVSAILTVMINGKSCEAYNIANCDSKITIAEFANIIAQNTGCKVVFKSPEKFELEQHSPVPNQVLDTDKLQSLGWRGTFTPEKGIRHLIASLNGK